MNETSAPVQVRDLVVGYGSTRVLTGAALTLPADATTVLLGRNGAGKTTLLRTLMGQLQPDSGTVHVLGRDAIVQHDAVCERVGYVPDRPDAWPNRRLSDVAALHAVHHPRWQPLAFTAALERFEISRDMRFRAMSKGQGMKAMIALALATDPSLLLLDEPFGGLDPVARLEVLDEVIGALDSGRRRTVFMSTHETEIAARIGEHLVILADGKLGSLRPMESVLGASKGRGADALGELLASTGKEESA